MIYKAGFFLGEFGWQLMRWQGYLRHLSKDNLIVVGCEKQYRYLYQDFAHDFVYFDGKIETRNMWMANQKEYPLNSNCIVPNRKLCLDKNLPQKFIRFGKKQHKTNCVLIHARDTNNLNTGYRNYNKWEYIVKSFPNTSFLSIGSMEGSKHIKGTWDLRGVSLGLLCDVMYNSIVLLSPSSGPAHLASLCGLKHIVWSGPDGGVMKNKIRYEKEWNPLNTECVFIEDWNPTPEEICKELDKCVYQ